MTTLFRFAFIGRKSGCTRVKKGAVKRAANKPRGLLGTFSWSMPYQTIKLMLIGCVVAGLASLLVHGIDSLKTVEVGSVEMYGYSGSEENNRGAREAELRDLAQPFLDVGFWDVDLAALQASLEQHSWVRRASIRRRWPNSLHVGIDEHVPIARWNRSYLLATSGALFEVPEAAIYASLPQITSPDRSAMKKSSVKPLVDQFNTLQRLLKPQGQAISEYGINEGLEHWLVLRSGARIELGRVDQLPRLQRLASLIESGSIDSWESIARADLRYRSGLSISWSDEYFMQEDYFLEKYDSIDALVSDLGR